MAIIKDNNGTPIESLTKKSYTSIVIGMLIIGMFLGLSAGMYQNKKDIDSLITYYEYETIIDEVQLYDEELE